MVMLPMSPSLGKWVTAGQKQGQEDHLLLTVCERAPHDRSYALPDCESLRAQFLEGYGVVVRSQALIA